MIQAIQGAKTNICIIEFIYLLYAKLTNIIVHGLKKKEMKGRWHDTKNYVKIIFLLLEKELAYKFFE